MHEKSAQSLITSVATIVIASVYFLFPLFFLTITTDFFTFPKQILVVGASLLLFILWGIKAIADKKATLLMNPLNIPVLAFAVVLILSTVFSHSIQDTLLQSVPVILLCLFFFTTVNFIQEKSSFAIVVTSLIIGSALSAILSILAYFNVFVLPFEAVRANTFNTHGSPVQYAAFILPILVLCLSSLYIMVKKGRLSSLTKNYNQLLQVVFGIVFAVSLVLVAVQIFQSPQKPILLPFNHGFQIAFASISQDAQRMIQSLLLGSGYGTFASDFTRFVTPAFNSNPYWNLTFAFSSSFILEVLATTGILGLASLIFIFVNFIRSKAQPSNPLFLALLTVFVLSLLIPFSFSLVFLLFALLALFVSHRAIENAKGFDPIALNFVTLKQGLISLDEEGSRKHKENLVIPALILTLAIISTVYVLFFLTGSGTSPRKGYASLVTSDIKFARSFSNSALQSGTETYNLQTQAISEYPYRADYYRLFSQINLALAANIVAAQQEGTAPTEEVQNNIIALLQQSINSARQAVTLSPYSALNWQNLGQIYRNLIGVGQNAEQFAVASYNQAITLNPSNPGLRIELGGIYYQLQQWDLSQNQFTIATQLKPDYANAYYNLGHSLEEKGDLQSALAQYQAVRQLVANDEENRKKVEAEIAALETKIGQAQTPDPNLPPTEDQTPLGVNQPQTDFPDRDPREEIPAPPEGLPTPTVTPSTSPIPTR